MRFVYGLIAVLILAGCGAELRRWFRGKTSLAEVIIVELFFLVCLAGLLFPSLVDFVAGFVGMRVRAFFFFTVSIVLLFVSVFSLLGRVDKLQQDVVRLVQSIAMLEERFRDEKRKE